MPFKRRCEKCGREFQPEGKFQRLCRDCRENVRNVNLLKMLVLRPIGVKSINSIRLIKR